MVDNAILMMQREVAKRLVAKPRTKDYGILTVALELIGKAKLLFNVPPQCFSPAPKVVSTVVGLSFNSPDYQPGEYESIMDIVHAGFNQRRKILRNSLGNYVQRITNNKIDDLIDGADQTIIKYFNSRAEELDSQDFIKLHNFITKSKKS